MFIPQRIHLYACVALEGLRMPAPVFFLPSDFSNFWICYTLWDNTKGVVWPIFFARDNVVIFEKWPFE